MEAERGSVDPDPGLEEVIEAGAMRVEVPALLGDPLIVEVRAGVADAAVAMNVGKSTMDKWVRQLKEERAGKSPTASPITPEQIKIRELKKRLQLIEM